MSRQPSFKINPSLRLRSKYITIEWQETDEEIIRIESSFSTASRTVFYRRTIPSVMCVHEADTLFILYIRETDWNNLILQKWLRLQIKNTITEIAERVLPFRLHELEKQKNLYAKGVTVKPLRKNVLGQCSFHNIIYLPPKLILLPDEYIDSVILHEMAHLKYKHHRKTFWKYLSVLLGEDSVRQKRLDIILSKYFIYADFLLKK